MMLDLESVRLFVLAAELGNFTRAAEAAGTVQPVVSQRIRNLEAGLGRKLLERTPRFVRLTSDGVAFMERARALLAAHDAAISSGDEPPLHLAIGISDHALGVSFGDVLRRVRASLPSGATIEVRLGLSHDIRAMFDAGTLDAAVIRREGSGPEGEILGEDALGWRAAQGWFPPRGKSLPLILLNKPCGVRAVAARALERAGLAWHEAFIGGGCAALVAAAHAGLGIAPMGRIASGGAPDSGPAFGLPPLPSSQIVLLARAGTPHLAAAARALGAGVRASLV